jgi:hypothetical protein
MGGYSGDKRNQPRWSGDCPQVRTGGAVRGTGLWIAGKGLIGLV